MKFTTLAEYQGAGFTKPVNSLSFADAAISPALANELGVNASSFRKDADGFLLVTVIKCVSEHTAKSTKVYPAGTCWIVPQR